jgi:hypothetical protein
MWMCDDSADGIAGCSLDVNRSVSSWDCGSSIAGAGKLRMFQ